jgi:Meiotically Up-regulated Gene 113 (MUG113) protein/KilA domain-containing protein
MLIYILTCDRYKLENVYKIGYTQDLKMRLATLNTGRIPSDKLYEVFSIPSKNADELERRLHKRLIEYRLESSEFFQFPFIDKLIDICVDEHNLLEAERTDNYSYHSYNNIQIKVRVADGYICMTDLCKPSTIKKAEEFIETKFGINAIESVLEIHTELTKDTIIQSNMLGLWCHPFLSTYVASWISKELFLWTMKLVYSYKPPETSPQSLNFLQDGLKNLAL